MRPWEGPSRRSRYRVPPLADPSVQNSCTRFLTCQVRSGRAYAIRDPQVEECPKGAPSPDRLSTAVSCTCLWSSVSPPSCPISGSEHVTPRFPSAGPDGHGSAPATVLSGRYDFLLRMAFGLLVRQPAPCGCLPIRVRLRAPDAVQARHRAGVWIDHAGHPSPATLPTGKNRISQVSWLPIPRLCAGPRPRTTLGASPLAALPVLPPD